MIFDKSCLENRFKAYSRCDGSILTFLYAYTNLNVTLYHNLVNIPISLQPNVLDMRYFKLYILLDQKV